MTGAFIFQCWLRSHCKKNYVGSMMQRNGGGFVILLDGAKAVFFWDNIKKLYHIIGKGE